jgi:hypothetical protein
LFLVFIVVIRRRTTFSGIIDSYWAAVKQGKTANAPLAMNDRNSKLAT